MQEFENLLFALSAMSAYRSLLKDEGIDALCTLLSDGHSPYEDAKAYGRLLQTLQDSNLTLSDYIYDRILYTESLFSRLCAQNETPTLSARAAARHDLSVLGKLGHISALKIKELLASRHPQWAAAIEPLPQYRIGHEHFALENADWSREVNDLVQFYRENGYGLSARLHAAGLTDILRSSEAVQLFKTV